MEKLLAIAFFIIVIAISAPVITRGEWISPTVLPPNWWGLDIDRSHKTARLAEPQEGYGMYRYDFWNNPSPYGRSVKKDDFTLRNIR